MSFDEGAQRLIRLAGKVGQCRRYITFQLVKVAVCRTLFAEILNFIAELPAPPPEPA